MTAATYDGDGVRASAASTPSGGSSSTQHFVYDDNGTVPQLLQDSTNAYLYGPGSTPVEQVNLSTGTVKYLVSDALGSVRGVVSSTGSLTASTSYDAWGNPETSGGLTSYTPVGFAGGYTDPNGLVYLINRYYDPGTGQFLSVDPLVNETGQAYAYTGDDPVDQTDPYGLGLFSDVVNFMTDPERAVTSAAKDVGNFVVKHKTVIEITAGVVLGVAAAATGVGAVVEAGIAIGAEGAAATAAISASAELGGLSLAAGAGATTLDAGNCLSGHNAVACVGFTLGVVGILGGGAGEVGAIGSILGWIAADSLPESALLGVGAFGSVFGVSGSIVDSIDGLSKLLGGHNCGS